MTVNNDILDSIHATREKIQERTKGMTPDERAAYHNREGLRIAQKYGFEHLLCDGFTTRNSRQFARV
jgi:hypothetical protein